MTRRRCWAVVASVLGGGVLSLALIAGVTQGAWVDQVHVAATAAAGQWVTAPVVPPPPILGGNQDTVLKGTDWLITGTPNDSFCVDVTITGASATPQPWTLVLRLDRAPFNGSAVSGIHYQGSNQVQIAAVPGDPSQARVTGVSSAGNPWNANWNNALLTSSQSLTIRLCDSSPGVPALGDPSWYTVSVAQGTWTPTLACLAITVTATTGNDNPFYFGWVADLSLVSAKNHITGSGKTVNYVSWTPDPSGGFQFLTTPSTYNPVADSYHIASGRMTAIKTGGHTTITACVNGF